MLLIITPNESDIFTAVRTYLLGVLPAGQVAYSGKIEGGELTVSKMLTEGELAVGDAVLGLNVAAGTVISAILTGAGKQGTYTVSPPQDVASATMSNGVEVIQSQVNRVPEPVCEDFITMTFTANGRLGTNRDVSEDVVFAASMDASVMTVTNVEFGTIKVGANVWGANVAPNTTIRALIGAGQYAIAPAQSVAAERMAAGGTSLTQPSQVTIQLDIHGPNSADFAQVISTTFRDGFGVDAFALLNPAISPLFSTDPRQMPFNSGEQQYEDRWVVELELQVDQTVRVPQQFADTVTVTPVSVEATYPVS